LPVNTCSIRSLIGVVTLIETDEQGTVIGGKLRWHCRVPPRNHRRDAK